MVNIIKTKKSNTRLKESRRRVAKGHFGQVQSFALVSHAGLPYQYLYLVLFAYYFLVPFSCIANTLAQAHSADYLSQDSQETSQDVKTQDSRLKTQDTDNQTSNREITRQLWLNRITPPKKQDDTRYKQELQQLIRLIRSVRFESKPPKAGLNPSSPSGRPAEPAMAIESTKKAEPNVNITVIEQAQADPYFRRGKLVPAQAESGFDQVQPFGLAAEQKAQSTTDKPLSYKPVSVETLQTLHKLSTEPKRIYNHLELAEILFLSGHLKEAAIFYRHALQQMIQDDLASATDKAWIIFQIANCLRNEDLQEAKKMYKQLITEYPDSPWADFAKAREGLIDWYLTDKPLTLIDENGS
jgi:tetratricopeptide (TPR) repeat protein